MTVLTKAEVAAMKCSAYVSVPGMFRSQSCSRKVVVHEMGKGWCRQHAPSSVAARRAKQDARFKDYMTKLDRRYQRDTLRNEAIGLIRSIAGGIAGRDEAEAFMEKWAAAEDTILDQEPVP